MFTRFGKTKAGDKAEKLARQFQLNSSELQGARIGVEETRTGFGILALCPILVPVLMPLNGHVNAVVFLASIGGAYSFMCRQLLTDRNRRRDNLHRDLPVVKTAVKWAQRTGRKPAPLLRLVTNG